MQMTRYPLGLPRGSVRAIVLLLLMAAIVAAMFLDVEIPETVETLATIVAGYYFGARVAETQMNDPLGK